MEKKHSLVEPNRKAVVMVNSMPIYDHIKECGETNREEFVKKMAKIFVECYVFLQPHGGGSEVGAVRYETVD